MHFYWTHLALLAYGVIGGGLKGLWYYWQHLSKQKPEHFDRRKFLGALVRGAIAGAGAFLIAIVSGNVPQGAQAALGLGFGLAVGDMSPAKWRKMLSGLTGEQVRKLVAWFIQTLLTI